MTLKKLMTAGAAIALAMSSTGAVAAGSSASALSLVGTPMPAVESVQGSQMEGEDSTIYYVIGGLVVLGILVFLIFDDDKDDGPTSP